MSSFFAIIKEGELFKKKKKKEVSAMNKEFEAFKKTLSPQSLKAIYDETRLEIADDHAEGTEAFAVAMASQMAINIVEAYQRWLAEQEK